MNRITADTLHRWILDGQELALLDAREDGAFGASHLFWAVPCGLARKEIRARALLPRLGTRVCCVDDGSGLAEALAAWLESIGCTDVSVLDGGTRAWADAGYILFSGVNVPSKAFGEWVEHHYGTESVDAKELKAWIDSGRDMVVLDSRTLEEFTRMSIPTGISVPGGQLVQATDTWIGVRNARIVLIDDTGVRARMSAAWLRQMGHRDVFVVEGGLEAVKTTGSAPVPVPELSAPVDRVDVTGLVQLLDSGAGTLVLDVGRSIDFRDGHIPGAIWGVRARLDAVQPQLAAARHVVVTSPDGMLARLAVPEVETLTDAAVHVLDGGTDAWHAFGRPLVKDKTTPPDEACIDFYLRPYDRNSGIEEAMNAYLSWEIDLVHEIERDGTVVFGVPGETHEAA
jgi:rhodanese-related sulfurtransferase